MNLTDPSGLQPPDTLGKHNVSQVATLQDARNSPGKSTRITVGEAEWPIPESGELLILLAENNEPGMSTVATNLEAKYEDAKLIDFDFQGTLIQRLKELKSDSWTLGRMGEEPSCSSGQQKQLIELVNPCLEVRVHQIIASPDFQT